MERGLTRGVLWLAEATPTPDQPYDPNDVTPGPLGFFATVFLFLAVGVLAMSLMRRSARAQERWAIREQLEREAEEEEARLADTGRGDEDDASRENSDDHPTPGS
ncbi:hypothetical protein [Gulosibacter chungangensis]|uniref:Uncharacterized protein n=1 Tax=Gulosibacter chungangensis TaxID=979746 RepID=A0A7J5BB11_9MICO|nr:hypothetical protein [Gulosibacter chungangensis]KAB1643261.1 hypothetical protein F8O05_08575 [Gulosibacter chungangensis]